LISTVKMQEKEVEM